jgi:hypothetical protein
VLVGLLVGAVRGGLMPLGVRGEWEWSRLPDVVRQVWEWFALAGLGVAAYSAFVGVGWRSLSRATSAWVEARWVGALLLASLAVQLVVPMGAPDAYGLTKWVYVNYYSGSSGYFRIARSQAAQDPRRFLADYPRWIQSQDSLHIGTHPPGLILVQCVLMSAMERHPGLAGFLSATMPPSVRYAFRAVESPFPVPERSARNVPPSVREGLRWIPPPIRRPERTALYATGLLTLLACSGTVVPLYLLARAALPSPAAWFAAALWPVVPAANLFQPDADTAYPFLSTMAWALTAWALRSQQRTDRPAPTGLVLAAVSGLVMAFGMVFTLAFLPVGLIVALIIGSDVAVSLRSRVALIVATGVGFLAPVLAAWLATRANPFVIWGWNLHHHARFYDEYPRTYWIWLWANVVELVIAIGLPAFVWLVVGLGAPRRIPRPAWATILVLVLVDLTGRNMGEVARIWMLFMPPLLIPAARGFERMGGGPVSLGLTTVIVGLQTQALQAMIQVVYPV